MKCRIQAKETNCASSEYGSESSDSFYPFKKNLYFLVSGPEIKMTWTTVYLAPGIFKGAPFVMTSSTLFDMVRYLEDRLKGP